jgi:hypothetical protein
MHTTFAAVLWIVCGVGIVAAFAMLATSGKAWEEYESRGLLMDHERVRGVAASSVAAVVALAERETDIREMLGALNVGRARRGEPVIDVEAELKRLTSDRDQLPAPSLRETD